MVELVGVKRFHDGEVVNDFRQVRHDLGNLGSALTVFCKLEPRPQHIRVRLDERVPLSFDD